MTDMPILFLPEKQIECELVSFDMTGTLIDLARLHARAKSRAQVLTKLIGDEAVINWAKLSGVDLVTWETDEDGPLAKAPRREDLIVAATAIYLTGQRWEKARELARRVYDEADRKLANSYKPALFKGVEDVLRRLKADGMKLAIATNDRRADAEETMKAVGVHDLFDIYVGADDVENPKPSPEMILLACERCRCTPSESVYIGDQASDLRAGRAAGVKAVIAVSLGVELVPELQVLADIVIRSVGDIRVN